MFILIIIHHYYNRETYTKYLLKKKNIDEEYEIRTKYILNYVISTTFSNKDNYYH